MRSTCSEHVSTGAGYTDMIDVVEGVDVSRDVVDGADEGGGEGKPVFGYPEIERLGLLMGQMRDDHRPLEQLVRRQLSSSVRVRSTIYDIRFRPRFPGLRAAHGAAQN